MAPLCRLVCGPSLALRRGLASAPKDLDLLVIGGGSGGLACAKEAASLGARVGVVDFVEASPAGSAWGLGGTCVNVGCIPKKLMHHAALLGKSLSDARSYGWDITSTDDAHHKHKWEVLRKAVQSHIKSLNFGHRVALKDKDVQYFNGLGSFIDPHHIRVKMTNGKEEILKSASTVIAVGLRPKYPSIPGAELGISSDDVFSLPSSPGSTLVVGGSYVGLECAGLLSGLGLPATVLVRSIPLRGFDQQMAALVLDHLAHDGTTVIRPTVPNNVSKRADGKLLVEWESADGSLGSDTFDTVLWAIGRESRLEGMDLGKAAVELASGSDRIRVDDEDRSSTPNIYAIGDIAFGRPELTPSAIMAGKLLARRLFGDATARMDYGGVATTVFTPAEYAAVGQSEEAAKEALGDVAVEVYHAFYKPLEYNIPGRSADECYLKVLADSSTGRLLGIHIVGPNAGEVMQGFAVALRAGATLDQLQSTVGIHPTVAEELVKVHISKRSGEDPTVSGC